MFAFQLLVVLLTLIAHASAERLLSGEEVGSFASRMIDENEVRYSSVFLCRDLIREQVAHTISLSKMLPLR